MPCEKGHPALCCGNLVAFETHDVPHRANEEADVARVFLRDPFGNRLEVVEGAHESVPAAPARSGPPPTMAS